MLIVFLIVLSSVNYISQLDFIHKFDKDFPPALHLHCWLKMGWWDSGTPPGRLMSTLWVYFFSQLWIHLLTAFSQSIMLVNLLLKTEKKKKEIKMSLTRFILDHLMLSCIVHYIIIMKMLINCPFIISFKIYPGTKFPSHLFLEKVWQSWAKLWSSPLCYCFKRDNVMIGLS